MSAPGKKKRFGKKLIIGCIVALVVFLIIGKKVTGGKNTEPVKTTKPAVGNVVERLTETGNIELLRTVEVKSKIAGTVRKILVNEGDMVRQGQTLCIVDPDPSQTLLLFQKRSAVDRAEIELGQAQKDMDRKKELSKTSMVSEKEVEDAINSYRIAGNSYNLAKHELEIMEREIETTGSGTEERVVSSIVRAPISGVVTQRYIEEGVLVTSGISSFDSGKNLFQIGDPSARIIRANVSEVDIGKVHVGTPVTITLDAYADTSFAGRIRHISPVGKLQEGRNVVSFNTEIEILDKDPRLQPGMSCDVDFILARSEKALYLPVEAVYEKKEGSADEGNERIRHLVFVQAKKDSTIGKKKPFAKKSDPLANFTEREITVGIKNDSRIVVTSKLDTTVLVAADAEKFFTDREAKKNGKSGKKGKNAAKGSNAK